MILSSNSGALLIPGRIVERLDVLRSGAGIASGRVNLPAPHLPWDCQFEVSFTVPDFDPKSLVISFTMDDGSKFELSGAAAADYFLVKEADSNLAEKRFFQRLGTPGYDRVLEVGSRARSGFTRRHLFQGKQYKGLDVMDGPNVDIVADAHVLAAQFDPESFDAVYSASTFEHLAMPWKVALELNKVLREGGVAYLITHQALGMHDMPWDFWRFSNTAWDSLFNEYTGFRVLETFLGGPVALVPHVYYDQQPAAIRSQSVIPTWSGFERSAGFSTSAVLIEKIGPSSLTWDLDVARAIRGVYPA